MERHVEGKHEQTKSNIKILRQSNVIILPTPILCSSIPLLEMKLADFDLPLLLDIERMYCKLCTKFIHPRSASLKCLKCSEYYHVNCTGLDESKAKYFLNEAENKKNGDYWLCDNCNPGKNEIDSDGDEVTVDASVIEATIDKVLNKQLKTLKSELLKSINADIKKINSRIDSIEKRQNELYNELKNVKETSTNFNKFELFDEMEDRRRRSRNVILYNMIESRKTALTDKISDDTTMVTTILEKYNMASEPIKVIRLGKTKNDVPRPTKVIFKSEETAIDFLKHGRSIVMNEKEVKVRSDLTPNQRDQLKYLNEELQARTQSGEKDLVIKYINGVPKIMKKSKPSVPKN
ncbi:hypothetical protein RI129_012094 [Pyrocoelia pectoralis]|uniref:PHD-type domain-containing protein n=1 Tax=Pyrocoelia pectoralis TaxID=417401 RepID=A0AAN7ZDM6_9COLE